jgi:HTH-type transcriptional regulator / antitoxin HipB
MIKNQKQASFTKSQLAELQKAKRELEAEKEKYDTIEYKLAENALNGMIEDLEDQISLYNHLVNGNFHCLKPEKIEDIPNILIAARLSQKMSQKELAEILGIQEQQVQRYEATDFEGASWARIVEFSRALDLKLYFEKVIIFNPSECEECFNYPENYSEESIKKVEESFKNSHSLIFE